MFEKYLKLIQNRVSTEKYLIIRENEKTQNFTSLEVLHIKNACFSEAMFSDDNGEIIEMPSLHTILAEIELSAVRTIILKLESILKQDNPEPLVKASGQRFITFVWSYYRYLTELFVERFIEKSIDYAKNPDDDFRKNPKEMSAWQTLNLNIIEGQETFDLMIINNEIFHCDGKSRRFNRAIQAALTNKTPEKKKVNVALSTWIETLTNEKYTDIIKTKRVK